AASHKTGEQLNSPGSINAPELPLPPPEIGHSPEMLKNAAEEKEYLKGAGKEMEKKKEEAQNAQKENEDIKETAEKWENEGKGRQGDFTKMNQKMGEKQSELQTDEAEIEKGEQKGGEIKDKGGEIKDKGGGAKSSSNVERARYPENPTVWQRIKRFFLQGVVGRFNRAVDGAKQTAMSIIMKGIEGAIGGDEIKQKLGGKKEEAKGSEKKLEKGKQEMQKGEKNAKEMEQQGAQEKMKAVKNIQEAKAVESGADKSLMEIRAQQKAVEKEEAQIKAKMEAYKSAYGPTVDYIKMEAVQQKGGAKIEDKLNVKMHGEAKVVQEGSGGAIQKAMENITEAEENRASLAEAAAADAYDSLGSSAEAIIPEIEAHITEIVSAFMSGEQERISRLQRISSDAAKFGTDKPSENVLRELANLRDSLKEEITAMSLSKDELMKALREGGMEIFDELAETAAARKQQTAQEPGQQGQ
ncbi:MAG: hypothetical protein FJ088_01885, partial [Deltaproteobacteria bacterium]|nr:hypothetical protein [Deltaproteobacteria bacterium]